MVHDGLHELLGAGQQVHAAGQSRRGAVVVGALGPGSRWPGTLGDEGVLQASAQCQFVGDAVELAEVGLRVGVDQQHPLPHLG